MASSILTLITDFGAKDHYVGTMKGVILSIFPDARLVDITHEIPPFSIHEGAYALAQSVPHFPPGTVHLIVVDPGVGTSRRAILAEANKQFFIAPDNGVLSLVLRSCRTYQIRELTNRALWRPSLSSTFHGRDIFAPVAAVIAGGKSQPEDAGPLIEDPIFLPDLEPQLLADGAWRGVVLSVDHFGNVITNFARDRFLENLQNGYALATGSHLVTRFHKTFGEAPSHEIFAYAGSSGYLEVGINQGSAAASLGLRAGDPVQLGRFG
ncbi:MAG TPA: SAM-dependent chlorinase/fluorinase [Bryobacteraceae bacterium]|jgi:S-adenosylmethionine hydrolase|nr:SAM-dependent chlorinase/fluorinase [Bryobacteraceae bacterium]